MKRPSFAARRRVEGGSVAVETAAVLVFLAMFITLPSIYWAFYFYTYSITQKTVHDVALYLSTAPRLEMTAAGPDGNPVAFTLARKIIEREMAGLPAPDLSIVCSYQQASGLVGSKLCTTANNLDYRQVLVQVTVSIDVSYIDPLTGSASGMRISPYAYVPYLGR